MTIQNCCYWLTSRLATITSLLSTRIELWRLELQLNMWWGGGRRGRGGRGVSDIHKPIPVEAPLHSASHSQIEMDT